MSLPSHLARFPSLGMGHLPTPIEGLPNLGDALGLDLHVKRDDLTGLGFGGNKVRQLNYYLGTAKAQGADTILITGAVQSNFARTAAAMARKLGMDIHIQLEDRVKDMDALYQENGNVLLDRLLGATLHFYPEGEDEAGADAALGSLAEALRAEGRSPYIVPLSANKPPLGALGYVEAAQEVVQQGGDWDAIFVGSGSALTHVGLLTGLRLLENKAPIHGICVRRNAEAQTARVTQRVQDLCDLLEVENPVREDDIQLDDSALSPGYGQVSEAIVQAVQQAARLEGLFLDPVYTGKVMAGLVLQAESLAGKRVLFWHTGGQAALFGYGNRLL